MGLSRKELIQLKALQKKQSEPIEPMTDEELERIENDLTRMYDLAPDFLKQTMDVWNQYTERLSMLADDNIKLVAEIRRLRRDTNP